MPEGLLARIKPVSQMTPSLKMSVYGQPKTGKTRLMASFPKPMLIIGAEDGTQSIRAATGVDFIRVITNAAPVPKNNDGAEITNYVRIQELGELVQSLDGSQYQSVGVDTASALADLLLANILGLTEIPAQKSWGMASRENYGIQGLQLKTILRDILSLRQHVVITAHERNFGDETPGGEMMAPTVGSALSASSAGWLNGAVDYVCQTFKRAETKEVEEEVIEGQKLTMKMPTGKAEYCLRVGPHPVYLTGFRLPDGYVLPDVVVNPTYAKIRAVIEGKYDGKAR